MSGSDKYRHAIGIDTNLTALYAFLFGILLHFKGEGLAKRLTSGRPGRQTPLSSWLVVLEQRLCIRHRVVSAISRQRLPITPSG